METVPSPLKLPSTEMTIGLVFNLDTFLYLWLLTLFHVFGTACEVRLLDWTLLELLGAYTALGAITGRNSLQLHPQVSSVPHCLLNLPCTKQEQVDS